MAKRSLKKRIDALVDALGGAEKPTLPKIRSELVALGTLADELEGGQTLAEKDVRIADLETQLCRLQVELQTANAEIEGFRAERKKQEEEKKRQEMPEIQFKILQGLPTENAGDGATLKGICQRASIPPDEADVHLDRLVKAGLAKRGLYDRHHVRLPVWHRTMPGNELVLAKRLAGEEEREEIKIERSKHGKLTQPEEIALLEMAERVHDGATQHEIAKALEYTTAQTALILILLNEKNMAAASDEPDYGTGRVWFILRNGLEHLTERGLI